ncbi:hypothetical protein LJR290_007473 [Variovorax sp. LjRoot290]|uniref:hypothetical protein n=1 Tax=Variovorax sp. LjRoot290 TaxID=3342316 RepID=UPI003ECEB89C
MGPITLFDKSFLQSLSTDEAVWFDNFFYPVISPLFLIETLADLWKTPRDGKTVEDEVGIIAAKTPQLHGGPCYFHNELCIQDLLGNHVPMTGQIPMAGMRTVVRDGKEGAIAEVSPEARAFHRWQQGNFYDVERFHAHEWRHQVESIDLGSIERAMKQIGISSKTCKTLDAALKLADEVVAGLTKTSSRFDGTLEVLEVPSHFRSHIKERWKRKGKPPLRFLAPYAAHVLRVELFFRAALGANLVASTRPSHKVDMAYLFYLPFCTLFTSSDKLHRQCAPLFMRTDQEFVWGPDLKADLGALNAHFSGLPEEVRRQGIYEFANRLPVESQGLIRGLFERHTPNLLKPTATVDPAEINKDVHKALLEDMKRWESAPSRPTVGLSSGEALETMIIKRSVSRTRGSWMQIGPEVPDEDAG